MRQKLHEYTIHSSVLQRPLIIKAATLWEALEQARLIEQSELRKKEGAK